MRADMRVGPQRGSDAIDERGRRLNDQHPIDELPLTCQQREKPKDRSNRKQLRISTALARLAALSLVFVRALESTPRRTRRGFPDQRECTQQTSAR